jgi:hypothetical protein
MWVSYIKGFSHSLSLQRTGGQRRCAAWWPRRGSVAVLPPPLSVGVVVPRKLGVSCRVSVPVGEGLATHPYRVLRLWRSRRKTTTNKMDAASTEDPAGRRGDRASWSAGTASRHACGGRRGCSRSPQATQEHPMGRGGEGPPASTGRGRQAERRHRTWEAP